jgi:hypothetical protein
VLESHAIEGNSVPEAILRLIDESKTDSSSSSSSSEIGISRIKSLQLQVAQQISSSHAHSCTNLVNSLRNKLIALRPEL